jgi:hypothetical protein
MRTLFAKANVTSLECANVAATSRRSKKLREAQDDK